MKRSRTAAAVVALATLGAGAGPALATVPDPLLTLDVGNKIRVVDANNPTAPAAAVPIRGLRANEVAVGLDYVATTQQVLLFTSTGTAYRLTNTYQAIPVSEALTGATGSITGVDWNPTTQPPAAPAPRIRIFAGSQNFRWLNETGQYVNDGVVFNDTGSQPSVSLVGAAYTNNDADPATGTTLYSLDATTNFLAVHSVSPQFSRVDPVGPTGVEVDQITGFDISGATGTPYAAIRNGAIDSSLYTIDLATGAATLKGKIAGGGTRITGLTAVPPSFFPPPARCGDLGGERGLLSLPLGNLARLLGSKQPTPNPLGQLVASVNCGIVAAIGL